MKSKSRTERRRWFFFSNNFHVLLYVARNPDAQVRVVADEVEITERAAHRILMDLAREGYITITKQGRRNHYRVNPGTTLRHRVNLQVPLDPLLQIINKRARASFGAHDSAP